MAFMRRRARRAEPRTRLVDDPVPASPGEWQRSRAVHRHHLTGGPPAHMVWADTPSVARQGGAPDLTGGVRGRKTEGGCRGQPGRRPVLRSPSGAPAPPRRRRRGRYRRVAIAEDLAVIHEPEVKDAFHVEQHGIDYIPESERWATPEGHLRHVGGRQRADRVLHLRRHPDDLRADVRPGGLRHRPRQPVLSSCSGCARCRGPNAGTTVFAINRAPFGPNGSRPISFFNWLTQIGFEVEGLILIVGAGLVLMIKAGYLPGRPGQGRPRHRRPCSFRASCPSSATPPSSRRCACSSSPSSSSSPSCWASPSRTPTCTSSRPAGTGRRFTEALAFTIALSGLGWTECGNDYTRYCPTDTSKKGIVGWVFLGTAVPEILIMTLGRRGRHLRPQHRDGRRRVPPLRPPERHPLLVRGGVPPLRRGAALRHQQPRHVLVGRDAAGHRRSR